MKPQPKSPREEFRRAVESLKESGATVEILSTPRVSGESVHASLRVNGETQAWWWDEVMEEWR